MAIKRLKPTTPGSRFSVINTYEEITTNKPEKSLLRPIHKVGGRNHSGKMTIRNVGGGHKRKYRLIDFKRDKHNVAATVVSIEYDPNRTAFIALLSYTDGEKRYIIAPEGVKVGMTLMSGEGISPEVGNSLAWLVFHWVL
jgi:large subunit ribosomal protein L2